MEYIIYLLIKYRYLILFPLSIVEGPIITIIAGFFCSLSMFHLFWVFPIIIAGDNIGDALYYGLGYWSEIKFIKKISIWLGLTNERMQKVNNYIKKNPYKTIAFSKIILGVGVAGLFLAGKSRFPFKKFLKICLLTSFIQCSFYLLIGWFFGLFYKQISHYLDYFASVAIVLCLTVLLFFIIKQKRKKYENSLRG